MQELRKLPFTSYLENQVSTSVLSFLAVLTVLDHDDYLNHDDHLDNNDQLKNDDRYDPGDHRNSDDLDDHDNHLDQDDHIDHDAHCRVDLSELEVGGCLTKCTLKLIRMNHSVTHSVHKICKYRAVRAAKKKIKIEI